MLRYQSVIDFITVLFNYHTTGIRKPVSLYFQFFKRLFYNHHLFFKFNKRYYSRDSSGKILYSGRLIFLSNTSVIQIVSQNNFI